MSPDQLTEAVLLADWVAEQDLAGRRVCVMPPALTRTVLGPHVDAEGANDEPVDLLLAVGVPVRGAQPAWYAGSSVVPGGTIVAVVALGEDDDLGAAIAALRITGMRCESFEELSEPAAGTGVRLLRLVQRQPVDDAVVAP